MKAPLKDPILGNEMEPPKDYPVLEDIRIYPKGKSRKECIKMTSDSWWTKIKRFFNVN